jgi:hypothetical protein
VGFAEKKPASAGFFRTYVIPGGGGVFGGGYEDGGYEDGGYEDGG